MATEREYIERISDWDWERLRLLWDAVKSGATPDWDPGKALEYLVLRAFQLDGAEVTWPYTVDYAEQPIEQIDGVVYLGGITCLVECKDKGAPLNVEPIAKMRNQLLRRPAGVIGILIGRSGFSAPARALAGFVAPQTILLWEGAELDCVLARESIGSALQRKYRYCVERGAPDYNLCEEDIR